MQWNLFADDAEQNTKLLRSIPHSHLVTCFSTSLLATTYRCCMSTTIIHLGRELLNSLPQLFPSVLSTALNSTPSRAAAPHRCSLFAPFTKSRPPSSAGSIHALFLYEFCSLGLYTSDSFVLIWESLAFLHNGWGARILVGAVHTSTKIFLNRF